MIAVALSLALTPGAVHVEVRAGADQTPELLSALRGAVARRLLEEGYPLTGEDSPSTTAVSLHGLHDSILIVVRSAAAERAAEVPLAREDLLRLEVSHRVLALLESMPIAAHSDAPTAAVGFRGRPPTDAEIELATAPLVEAGFVVVAEDVPADWAVCVTRLGSTYTVQRSPAPPCAETSSAEASTGSTLAFVMASEVKKLAADREASELAELQALAETVEAEPEQPPATTLAPKTKPEPAPARALAWGTIDLVGGVQGRTLVPEATFGLRGGGGKGLFGVGVDLSFTPSGARGLSVLDTFIAAGPMLRGRVSHRVALAAGVFAGVAVHRHRFGDGAPTERYDPQLVVPLSATVYLAWHVGLVFAAHVGVSSRPREHVIDGEVLWARDRLRWGATAGLQFAFGPGGGAR